MSFWLHESTDTAILVGYDAGASFKSTHDPHTGTTCTVLSTPPAPGPSPGSSHVEDREDSIMKLTTITNISLDGVTQGHRRIDAGPDASVEDGSVGFERFGWGPPLLDDEASTFIGQAFQRADAFLFGRRTYEIFAGSWGVGMDPGNPVGEALNTRPKYVASTTLTDPRWAGTTIISGDVAAAVGELRAGPSGELQVWGSGTLIRWLLHHRLVDEIVLLTYPVIVGQGTRLFPATGPDTGLELVDVRSTPKGLTIQTFRTAGRPQYETS